MSVVKQSKTASATQAAPLHEFDDVLGFRSAPVRLNVSKDGTFGRRYRFFVHEKVVRSRSEFLDRAFNHAGIDSDHQRFVSFTDDDPDIMNAYLYWLYFAKFRSQPATEQDEYGFLAKLYIFGEEHKDRAFQDAVLNMIVYQSRKRDGNGDQCYPVGSVVKLLYDSTPPGSPMRQLLVDMSRTQGHAGWISSNESETHIEFLADLVRAFMNSQTETPRESIQELVAGQPLSYHHLAADKSDEKNEEENGTKTNQATPTQPTTVKSHMA